MEVINERVALKLPDFPKTLPKVIAPITKPEKKEIIEKKNSTFRLNRLWFLLE